MSQYTIGGDTITVLERDISRSQTDGSSKSVELIYAVHGSSNDASVRSAVKQEAPSEYNGLYRQTIELEAKRSGSVWQATVTYGEKDLTRSSVVSVSDFRFDTAQQTRRVYQAKSSTTKRFAKSGETAPDMKGVIGWDGEGLNGVDVNVGAFRFSILRRFTDSEVTADYLRLLSRKHYRVNDAAFWLWDAGEVLFEGASGGRSGGGVVDEQGDDDDQLSGYEGLTGVTGDNTDAGRLYFAITKLVGVANYDIDIYKDSAMTTRVGYVSTGVVGSNAVTSDGGSGIGGTITLDQYVADTTAIAVEFPFAWEITLQFAISENETGIDVGDLVNVEAEGWEYLDVYSPYETVTIGGSEFQMSRPKYAWAHPVYGEMDFSELKAGDNPFA